MKRVVLAALVLVVLLAAWLVRPLAPNLPATGPMPAPDYATALRWAEDLRKADRQALMPGCGTQLFTHGRRTPHVLVLFHGLTNCPAQFDSLGQIAFAHGANVFIPRLPYHGLGDRLTREPARTDARILWIFTQAAIDIAHGLGDTVTVCGLSTGGVMAAWAGQERADVDRAVVIAPMLGYAGARGPVLTNVLVRLATRLPNRFVWWDDELKEKLGGPEHVYPRFATRAVAATLMLGTAVRQAAARTRPAARSLVLLTVGGDQAADNGMAHELLRAWRDHGARTEAYEFPPSLHLVHDVVDPAQVGANPTASYPVIERYIVR